VLSGIVDVTHRDLQWQIDYNVKCAVDWRTRDVRIVARHDAAVRTIGIKRGAKAWVIVDDGQMQVRQDLVECIDIDLGFTPSTNVLPILRLDLAIGSAADVSAAWVRFPELTLERLDQRYTRLAERTFLYESGGGSFRRELTVNEMGLVIDYPDFWKAEPPPV
jgi:hypothetical protein